MQPSKPPTSVIGGWALAMAVAVGGAGAEPPASSAASDVGRLLKTVTVVTASEGGGARPEVVATAERVIVVFLQPKNPSGPVFRVKIFNSDLSRVITEKVLVTSTPDAGRPTDIRVASDGKHLYAFYETVVGRSGGFLWGAQYTLDDRFERVAQIGPIAKGRFWTETQEGDELINDPISLMGPESVFVITRLKGKSLSKEARQIYRVREFTPNLRKKLAEFDLDLSRVAAGSPRQSSAAFWRGHFYMVVPTSTRTGEFPVDMLAPSGLVMVKLDRKWKIVDSKLISNTPGEVETFVTAFQEHEGRFYVASKQGTIQRGFGSPLKIYDGNFDLLHSETVRKAAGREETRPSLAVTDRHIYVAYGVGQGPPPLGALAGGRNAMPGGDKPEEAVIYVYERTRSKTTDRAVQSIASTDAVTEPLRLEVPIYRELVTHIHRPADLEPGEKRPAILFVYPGKVRDFACKLPAELAATQRFITAHFSPADNLPAEFDAAGREGLGHAGQDAVHALLKHLLSLPEVDTENVGIVTHSGGVVAATGALARHPDVQVKFLIDWEGPSGFRGAPPDKRHVSLKDLRGSSSDKEYAAERAASEFIKRVRCCYLRLQGEIDHAQPRRNNTHAIEMLNNAAKGLCPWTRCNNNPPNILYDDQHPENEKSKWFPGSLAPCETDKLIAGYVTEMIKLSLPKTKDETANLSSSRAVEGKTPLPVYVYLFSHYEDHINIELSEWRIKEVMHILSEAHRAHPDRLAAVGEFYGADSEISQERNKESGIVDLFRRAVGEGWYDVGYHGAHEPTYATTAQANRNMTGKGWTEIYEATRTLYTVHRDLKTGKPDGSCKGGVARMQDVFGPATVLSGATGPTDPPGLLALNDLTGCRVIFGFTDHGPAMFNKDYIPAVLEARKLVSPTPETSPDVFWFMGSLVVSSHPDTREIGVINSELPPDEANAKFERLDRTRVAVPHMICGTKFIYARASPTEYAYAGADRIPPQARGIRQTHAADDFRLPSELLFSEAERKQKLENFRQTLDWLLTKYFPANPGSRCVGNRLLLDLTVPYAGDSVSAADLDHAAEGLLRDWTERPPSFTFTGTRYLTLAQTFKLLATALKSHAKRNSLPATFQTDLTYGPIGTWPEVVQCVETIVEARAVITAASQIVFGPERQRGEAQPPANRVPLNATSGGRTMHAAQFLRLMAEAYQALRAGKLSGTLSLRPSNILPPLSPLWKRAHRIYEDTPAAYSYLQLWTVKPAQFKEVKQTPAEGSK